MTDPVVVGIDGSPASEVALNWAVDEAAAHRSALRIIYALHMPLVSVPFGTATMLPPSEELEKQARDVLAAASRRAVGRAPDIDIDTELSLLQPSEALIGASERATLVVVGTRGLGVLGRAFLGSVSTRVAASASCPTLVVPGSVDAGYDGRPVIVGVDGSSHSRAAVRFALDDAARRGTRVVALTAYLFPLRALPAGARRRLDEFADDARRDALALVSDVVDEARADQHRNVEVELRVVDEFPVDALVEASRDAALTVVGSRGLGGFRGMLLGSVSQAVLQHSDRPVVVVRARDGEE